MTDKKAPTTYQTMTEDQQKKQTQHDLNQSSVSAEALEPNQQTESKSKATEQTNNVEQQLQQTIVDLEQKIADQQKELQDSKIRNLADIKNIQERYSREAATTKAYAHQYFAKDILDIVDALDQAEQSLDGKQKEGIQLITEMLQKAFQKHHIETIDPTGENYDHHFHEAMAMQPSETVADNHVIQVVQKGYRIKDRLLRAARVIVAKNPK